MAIKKRQVRRKPTKRPTTLARRTREEKLKTAKHRIAERTLDLANRVLSNEGEVVSHDRRQVVDVLLMVSRTMLAEPVARVRDVADLKIAIGQIDRLRESLKVSPVLFLADVTISARMALVCIKLLWPGRTTDFHIDEFTRGDGTMVCDIHFEANVSIGGGKFQAEDVHMNIDCSKVPEAKKIVDRLNTKFGACNHADDQDIADLGKVLI